MSEFYSSSRQEMDLSLTSASYPLVTTHQLATPVVAWVNEEKISEQAAAENSFCICQDYESPKDYVGVERTQYADRYGGYGVRQLNRFDSGAMFIIPIRLLKYKNLCDQLPV
jgi:hypothetical protein